MKLEAKYLIVLMEACYHDSTTDNPPFDCVKKKPDGWVFMGRPYLFSSRHIGYPLSLRMRLAIVRLFEPFSSMASEIQYLLVSALSDLSKNSFIPRTEWNVQHALFMDTLLQNLA